MILVTSDTVSERRIAKTLGIVRGNTVRAADMGSDISAWFKNLVGGELPEYTKLLAEAREQSLDRMIREARNLGADAIVGVRFATSEITSGAAEFLAYGTAVKLD